jgi:hypothetical protein
MKTFLFIVGLLPFFACQISAQTTRDNLILSEPLRKCAEPTHPVRDKEIDCLHGLIHTVHSEIVALVKRGDTYVNDQTTQIKDITYDRQGNTVERIVYGFDFKYQKHVDSRVVYTYDGQRRATGWEDYADGRPVPAKSIYSYDSLGNRISETVTQADGKIRAVLTLIYDAKGQNIEKRYESGFDPSFGRLVNVYDGKGNLIQSCAYNAEGKLVSKSIFSFDAKGNRIKVEGYGVNSNQEAVLRTKTSYEYDDKGVNTGIQVYGPDGALRNKVLYKYNDHGDVSSITRYERDGTFGGRSVFEYEYDSHGNWTKCTHLNQRTETALPGAYYADNRTLAYY